jgi:exodeoxyribonuclease VII large subunit
VDHAIDRQERRVGELRGQLRALSPQRTLERGYAIAQRPGGGILRSAADAVPGEALLLTLADGEVPTAVTAPGERAEGRG